MAEETGTQEAPKQPRYLSKDYDEDSGEFSFTFADGTKVEGDLSDFPPGMLKQLALHGIMQKAGDSTASLKGNIEEGIKAINRVLDQLKKGEWGAKREPGEGGPRVTELVHAIAAVTGKTLSDVAGIVDEAEDEKKKAWRANPQVQAAIAKIRADKAAAKAAKAQAAGEAGALQL